MKVIVAIAFVLLSTLSLQGQKCCAKVFVQFWMDKKQCIDFSTTEEFQLQHFLIDTDEEACTISPADFIPYGEQRPAKKQLALNTQYTAHRLLISRGKDTMLVDLYLPFNEPATIETMRFCPGYFKLDLKRQTDKITADQDGRLLYQGVNRRSIRKKWAQQYTVPSLLTLTRPCKPNTENNY